MEAASESQSNTGNRSPLRLIPAWSIALALAAGLVLRLWMLQQVYFVDGDSLIYGSLAKNLLLHGRYALTAANGVIYPTLIRLPGYPFFLTLCFQLFGMENYMAAAWVQIALELAGCLLLADFAGRIVPPSCRRGAARGALWLAALCPFTASYAALPLSESLTLLMLALALWSMARFAGRPGWGYALTFTAAVTYATLLRPDGALMAVALAPALLLGKNRSGLATGKLLRMTVACVLLALAPFAIWGWRNWQVFGVFQPLAPRLATDPGEASFHGWERWVKSWCLDFVSTYDIYWNVPDGQLDVSALPGRAFDSPAQYAETARLAADYNRIERFTPALNTRFSKLADERIRAHPFRYYLWLPLGRVADMWLRPRTENLPFDVDWWVYENHPGETILSWLCAGLNACYLLLGLAGLCLRFSTPGTKTCPWGPRFRGPIIAYILLRSALLLTIAAPEARYTLECYPLLCALGGAALYRFTYVVFRPVLKLKASPGSD